MLGHGTSEPGYGTSGRRLAAVLAGVLLITNLRELTRE
jgi:hypothetical protein